jgi:hypothetical protein
VREPREREDSQHEPLFNSRFARRAEIMTDASHQSQLVRADIEDLQRAVRDLNRHRAVGSPDTLVAHSNATRLSAPTGGARVAASKSAAWRARTPQRSAASRSRP